MVPNPDHAGLHEDSSQCARPAVTYQAAMLHTRLSECNSTPQAGTNPLFVAPPHLLCLCILDIACVQLNPHFILRLHGCQGCLIPAHRASTKSRFYVRWLVPVRTPKARINPHLTACLPLLYQLSDRLLLLGCLRTPLCSWPLPRSSSFPSSSFSESKTSSITP